MKKAICALCIACLSITFAGCNKLTQQSQMTEMEKIQKQLNEMENYQCTATMERYSNKGNNTYETNQYFKSTGEYRLELTAPEAVAGNYTIFDGEKICQFNPRVSSKIIKEVPQNQQRNELFLGQFLKNYMQSEGVSVEAAALDESRCTVLEAVIPGGNQYTATEKLWVDNETLKPVQFVIYDDKGNETYHLSYHTFEYDAVLDDNLFKITE